MMMFKIMFLLLLALFVYSNNKAQSNIADNNGIVISQKIAKKMKDTLDLTAQQRQQLFDVNLSLHSQTQNARNTGVTGVALTTLIQRIENTRDSLYRPIIGEEKYELYLQKKRNVINNN